ncbi:hypothetical protein MSAN_01985600 [Mycena sanguinolenta]|uniref:ER membrane protein complex subunit 1 n=1 Tax=Mycena sanguinolenta TaxID=230812 RepID=A0A8H7CPN1_9AGAR|nr:hypothetical protein MSAN_01985600 [Mycena sanguinolenta]
MLVEIGCRLGLPDEIVVSTHDHTASLARDAFGFKQVLVTATAYGTVLGLDTASGAVLWTRILDAAGGTVKPAKIFVVDGHVDRKKDIVLIVQRKAQNTLVDIVVFRIDPLTGAGRSCSPGALIEAFILPESDVVILVDEFFQINPYPEIEASTALLAHHAPNLYLPFMESSADGPRIQARPESVGQVHRAPDPHVEPIVSLGNRTTLYKYLNPRMFVVLTKGESSACGMYVVDGAKGSMLYGAGSTGCDVHATLVENCSDMSAFSVESMQVEALEQSYIFAHGITAIITTSTKFSITPKDIIGRKPTAEEQQEEQLIQYDILIPEDPRRTISHTYEIAQTRYIITSTALLESTSLVFAYGLDLFFTRVAPSNTLNKNFNKAQLVLTVSGLALGIVIAKPVVRRKRLRERWYN